MQGRAPGVSIAAADPQVRAVAPARTDVAAFVGIAARGPVGVPVRVTAFREFERTFGSFTGAGFLAYAVKAFFENGGRAAWAVRAAAPAVSAMLARVEGARVTPATPLPLLPGTLVTFEGESADGRNASVVRTVVAADANTGTLTLDAPLTGADPHEQPPLDPRPYSVLASSGAVSAHAMLRRRGGRPAAFVTASSPGGWGNALAVRVLHELVTQTTVVASPANDTGAFAVASVARIARGSIVRLRQGAQLDLYRAVADVDPVAGMVRVHSTEPGRALRDDLNQPLPSAPPTGDAAPVVVDVLALRVMVLLNGNVVEDYDPVSPVALDDLAARLRAAGSRIAFDSTSIELPTLLPATWLADVAAAPLGGGTDGARMVTAEDLLAGLAALAPLREPTLIAIPDACARGELAATTARAEQGPDLGAAGAARVAQALVSFCELGTVPGGDAPRPSFRFALVDVPWGVDPLAFRAQFEAARAALHWPWAGVYDALGPPGAVRFVPPSGHVAGAFAATDLALGVHHAAANGQLRWVVSLAHDVDTDAQPVYNDAQVNCIRAFPNRGIRVYGARTLASSGAWLYVPVRRLVSMIESAIVNAMQWAVFEPSSPTLQQLVRRSCMTLLDTLWQSGAFAGASQSDAYYVVCDGSNNAPRAQSLGELVVDVGIAPVRPAEFIAFRVGHQHDVLEVFEGAAA